MCSFLYVCGGYYNYEAGFNPPMPGEDSFKGPIVHPQKWPADLDYTGKRVVVIGSGATAVTLIPAMADKTSHITMLQRSPSYFYSRAPLDKFARFLNYFLPLTLSYAIVRVKNIFLSVLFYVLARTFPNFMKKLFIGGVSKCLHSRDPEMMRHFTPSYNPWDQRVCLVPDGDLFCAIRAGKASVVTDHIASFTPTGIALKSGATLDADIIVKATGLDLLALGGLKFVVDGRDITLRDTVGYRGVMLSGVPNMAFTMGYVNASWTLKADLVAVFVCRLLLRMRAARAVMCTPTLPDAAMPLAEWTDFSSGYFQRGISKFPRAGLAGPWRVFQNYVRDVFSLRWGTLSDGLVMK